MAVNISEITFQGEGIEDTDEVDCKVTVTNDFPNATVTDLTVSIYPPANVSIDPSAFSIDTIQPKEVKPLEFKVTTDKAQLGLNSFEFVGSYTVVYETGMTREVEIRPD